MKNPASAKTKAGNPAAGVRKLDSSRSGNTAESAFPIVGMGASAGGLAAFEAFFSGMPAQADPGMAFVLVQHLAPDHKSILTELVRRYTRMQVFEVEDGMQVQVNCAYIIPPNRDMAFLNGALQLLEPTAPRGHRLPIDFFFNSLARDQHERAIGIVLSGTGSDGTAGIRAIKGEGGMVMAQLPASTEFDGMPRSAIATGLVDFELPAAEMPAQLIAYAAHAFVSGVRSKPQSAPQSDNAMKKVFVLLRAQTGHDFSQYKPSTVGRRVERRMAVHQLDGLDDYVKFLQQTPSEAQALFRDLLIGVTHFFRDPLAFKALETQAIPKLFENKSPGDAVRVWCTGCSTGEEAYSIAILLHERIELLQQPFKVQIFATDIDSRAIAAARAGLYPASIATDISEARLARYFTLEPDGLCYRISKNIRDMLVFSEQDLIKDPPFSKLDLISCRNLLIYMGAELQKRLIPMFHFTLNTDGLLFLGTSESVSEFADLFATVDQKSKLYRRRPDFASAQHSVRRMFPSPTTAIDRVPTASSGRPPAGSKLTLRELTEQSLLRHLDLSAVLVNAHGDILYQHGRTGLYLEPAPGEAGINNVLKMAREGLRRELSVALHDAAATRATVRTPGLRVKTNGHHTLVNIVVEPVLAGTTAGVEVPMFLVVLEQPNAAVTGDALAEAALLMRGEQLARTAAAVTAAGTATDAPAADAFDRQAAATTIARLSEELRANREYLQATNEELETSNEELKSSNEEMQSVNEELQSTNEELETSKEEMQSVNEELATVNSELQIKVEDLSRASNDMKHLLVSTGIGTVFVDHQLLIQRYTPTATRIINLIPTDIGRPIAHTVSNLVRYDQLVADVQSVLTTLVPMEVEVESAEGQWYTMRIQPYRTFDNVIEGAVLTFVDITEAVHARQALRNTSALFRLAVVVRDAFDAITVQDLDGRILAWNPGAVRVYGWSEAEALLLNVRERIPAELQEQAAHDLRRLCRREILPPQQTVRLARDGSLIEVAVTTTALVNELDQVYAIATTERPIDGNVPAATGERRA